MVNRLREDIEVRRKAEEARAIQKAQEKERKFQEIEQARPKTALKSSRSNQKFIEDQIKFEARRYEKLAEIVQREEEESGNFQPRINPKSETILAKKEERMADQESVQQPFIRKMERPSEPTFTPKINPKSKNLHRAARVEVLLESDAKRREFNKSSIVSKAMKELQQAPKTPTCKGQSE